MAIKLSYALSKIRLYFCFFFQNVSFEPNFSHNSAFDTEKNVIFFEFAYLFIIVGRLGEQKWNYGFGTPPSIAIFIFFQVWKKFFKCQNICFLPFFMLLSVFSKICQNYEWWLHLRVNDTFERTVGVLVKGS